MREFTIFKVGDVVEIQNEIGLSGHLDLPDKATVVYVKSEEYSHAYLEECDEPDCIHENAHPQLLKVQGEDEVEHRCSGYWYDPIIKERNHSKASAK